MIYWRVTVQDNSYFITWIAKIVWCLQKMLHSRFAWNLLDQPETTDHAQSSVHRCYEQLKAAQHPFYAVNFATLLQGWGGHDVPGLGQKIRKWHMFLTERNPEVKVNHNQNNPNKGKLTWTTASSVWAVRLPLIRGIWSPAQRTDFIHVFIYLF